MIVELLKKLIEKKFYSDKAEIGNKLDVFYAMSKITDEEYSSLTLQVEEVYVEIQEENEEKVEVV